MNNKTLEQQIDYLYNIRSDLETIINHPNRNILDIIMVDYILLQRDNIDNAIQQSVLIQNLKDKELIENRKHENNNIIQSINLDNILQLLSR